MKTFSNKKITKKSKTNCGANFSKKNILQAKKLFKINFQNFVDKTFCRIFFENIMQKILEDTKFRKIIEK
jgi:hypothetical protein